MPSLQFKISLSWSLDANNLASVFRWAPALLYKYLYSRNTLVPDESDLLLCHHPVNCAFRYSFSSSSFQKPIFCCQDVCLSFSSYHNIGFSSAFPRNQSRLCDLCSWWANHHVVFCQIPDSSCLFTWWYSNTPFLVCIKTASKCISRERGFVKNGLLWSQKHLAACEMVVKGMDVQAKGRSAELGLQCWP